MPNPVRVTADIRINMKQFENLVANAPQAVLNALQDVSSEALQIAKDHSRYDTGEMQKGWRRSQIGFKSSIKLTNDLPGYRIYNNTKNKYGETYTPYHEFGTQWIDPQPMLGPALDYIDQNLINKVQEYLGDAASGSLGVSAIIDNARMVPME